MYRSFGYVRVSSKDQNVERQLVAMKPLKIPEKNLYVEKISGKDFDRPQYQRLLKKLEEEDVLYVKSIDRLGRNYEDIIEQWRFITKEIGADIVVLDMPLLDTRKGKDLVGTLIADIVLQLLSFVAQSERESIRQRQAEGIAVAKARGVRFGRRSLKIPKSFEKVYWQWKMNEISAREASRRLNVDFKTFKKWCIQRDTCINKEINAEKGRL
ncbi:MAG: recombinase family protein [Ruminococcus sp.]|jgi:DNA invertase Pin-like site-specific DNA recombinase|nr:recombinase family protein [Ruminococcus sp.]